MPIHSGSDGFRDGPPKICDECFREQRLSKKQHFYCEHTGVLTVDRGGCWETFRVKPDELESRLSELVNN
jgi:hypothetical protein